MRKGALRPLFLVFSAVGRFDDFAPDFSEVSLLELVGFHNLWCLSRLLRS